MPAASDCGQRCQHEKRAYCKDLHKWSKNLLCMVGLECVAKQFQRDKRQRQGERSTDEMCDSVTEVSDWNPDETCAVCSYEGATDFEVKQPCEKTSTSKVKVEELQGSSSNFDVLSSVGLKHKTSPEASTRTEKIKKETGQQLTSATQSTNPFLGYDSFGGIDPTFAAFLMMPGATTNLSSMMSPMNVMGSPYSGADYASYQAAANYMNQLFAWAPFFNMGSSNGNYFPFGDAGQSYSQATEATSTQPQLQQTNEKPTSSKRLANCSTSESIKKKSPNLSQATTLDQPLDLSMSALKQQDTVKLPDYSSRKEMTPPEKINGSSTMSNIGANKRTYSQTDLDKAVQDIINGRLGTRRASVVYGIPRSTLRNKVYKIEASDETVASKRLRKGGYPFHSESTPAANEVSSILKLQTGTDEVDASGSPTVLRSIPPPIDSLTAKLWTTPLNFDPNSANLDQSNPNDVVQMAVKAVLENRLSSENQTFQTPNLKFHEQKSSILLSSPRVENARKLALSKCLENKNCSSSISSSRLTDCISYASSDSRGSFATGDDGTNSPHSDKTNDDSSKRNDDPEKRYRPKRGQYRRYDKDDLAKAVKSVRSGEMSVHRAGSHFGVPHSTLEYKVKERNLLRPRKRDLKIQQQASLTNTIDAVANTVIFQGCGLNDPSSSEPISPCNLNLSDQTSYSGDTQFTSIAAESTNSHVTAQLAQYSKALLQSFNNLSAAERNFDTELEGH